MVRRAISSRTIPFSSSNAYCARPHDLVRSMSIYYLGMCPSLHLPPTSHPRRTTPLIFFAKFVFKLYMDGPGRAVVIKIPLVRSVMPKRELADFLRIREERRTSSRLALTSRRSTARSSALPANSLQGGAEGGGGDTEGGAGGGGGDRERRRPSRRFSFQI